MTKALRTFGTPVTTYQSTRSNDPEVRNIQCNSINTYFKKSVLAVPWLRQLVDPGSVHVGFVVDKVALGQVFLSEYFGLPPVNFIPPVLQ
jgi:hypothetical protein